MPKSVSSTPVTCPSCEWGRFRPTNLRGRQLDYRGTVVTVEEDLVVPVCDTCGDLRLGGEPTAALSRVLERQRARAEEARGSETEDAERARYALGYLFRANPLATINAEQRYWTQLELDVDRLATDVREEAWLPPLQLAARLALELWADATGGARPEPPLTVAELCHPTLDWMTGGVLLRAVAMRGGYDRAAPLFDNPSSRTAAPAPDRHP